MCRVLRRIQGRLPNELQVSSNQASDKNGALPCSELMQVSIFYGLDDEVEKDVTT